jgi:hypothetical protein
MSSTETVWLGGNPQYSQPPAPPSSSETLCSRGTPQYYREGSALPFCWYISHATHHDHQPTAPPPYEERQCSPQDERPCSLHNNAPPVHRPMPVYGSTNGADSLELEYACPGSSALASMGNTNTTTCTMTNLSIFINFPGTRTTRFSAAAFFPRSWPSHPPS